MVQNAWFKAHQAIGQFDARAQIRTWPGRIAINEAIIQSGQQGRDLLFIDWQSDDESGAEPADRFRHNRSWHSPPIQWNMDTPQDLLVRQGLANYLARA